MRCERAGVEPQRETRLYELDRILGEILEDELPPFAIDAPASSRAQRAGPGTVLRSWWRRGLGAKAADLSVQALLANVAG